MVGDSRRAGGTVAFARAEWRARWRSHVVVAWLAAITAAVLLATFCAAERSGTAFDRLRDATNASDVLLEITSGNPDVTLLPVRKATGVVDARAMSEMFVRPAGTDLFPTFTLTAIAPRFDDATSSIDTPVMTDGRLPRPSRLDEVALSAGLADELGVEPGDELRLESMTEAWRDAAFSGTDPGAPDGPMISVTVTGIARSPAEFGLRPSVIHLTPAFIERYDGRFVRYDAIHVRVEPEALERYREDELVFPGNSNVAESPYVDGGTTKDGLGTIATALRLVGLMAAVAGALTLGLALARASLASRSDRSTLVALGWTRADELRALALVHIPAVVAGLALGVAVGVVASPRAMVGLARAIDPRPDSVLVSSGVVLELVVAAVAATAFLLVVVGALATRRSSTTSTRIVGTPIGRPLAVTLGLRHALVAPADRGGRASRGATVAMVGATAVALGALVVSSSIGRLLSDPSLTGRWAEQLVDSGLSTDAFDEVMPRLEADDRIEALAGAATARGHMAGIGEIFFLILDARRGQLDVSVTEGRMPQAADEVALGPATVEAAGAHIGEEVTLSGPEGSARYRVVGAVLFPEGDFSHDEGAALTVDGGEPLVNPSEGAEVIHQVLFDWADDVDAEAANRELAADGFVVLTNTSVLIPGSVTNLGQVERLPRQLALLVGLLAVATLLHAAWTGVALRARELMTLRAIGITKRSITATTWTHALAIVVVGVLIGAPVGVVAGRQAWRLIAENAHVVVHPVVTWSWFGTVVGVAALTGLAVAALAGRWAGRLRPTVHLRAE